MGSSDALNLLWELQDAYASPERVAEFDREHPGYETAAGLGVGSVLRALLTNDAEAVWVDADTCALMTHAAEPDAGLPAHDGLVESDVFTPVGLCLFAQPLIIEELVPVVALSWSVRHPGIWFATWRDWRLLGVSLRPEQFIPHRLMPTPPVPYEWQRPMDEAPVDRAVMTLFLLANQFEAARTSEEADRPTRRRGMRQRRVMGKVTIVRLPRRRGAKDDAEADPGYRVEHDHRWWVRPHWRRQWYPKQQRHRPILIAGHARGPADKPLVVRDRVWEVRG